MFLSPQHEIGPRSANVCVIFGKQIEQRKRRYISQRYRGLTQKNYIISYSKIKEIPICEIVLIKLNIVKRPLLINPII